MKKILFVDDEVPILDMIEEFFSEFGEEYKIYTATNGSEALEILKDEDIQVIVTDVQMPVMNGLELCREIRKFDQTSAIIALTAFQKLFRYMQCRQEGFDDCLKKPFNPEELKEIVDYSFKKISRWKQLFNEARKCS